MPRPRGRPRKYHAPYTGPIPPAEALATVILELIAADELPGWFWAEMLQVSPVEAPHLLALLPTASPLELEQARAVVRDAVGLLGNEHHWVVGVERLVQTLRKSGTALPLGHTDG